MTEVRREVLSRAVVGVDKTWLIRIRHRGSYLNLSTDTNAPFTITASAGCVDTAEVGLTVTCTNYTQTDDDTGLLKATIAAAVLTAARVGTWDIDLFITASGGNRELLDRRRFTLESLSTTEA